MLLVLRRGVASVVPTEVNNYLQFLTNHLLLSVLVSLTCCRQNSLVNMVHSTSVKAFPPGIHVPSLTWFSDDAAGQEIDWPTQNEHIKFLISSGLHGSMSLRPLGPFYIVLTISMQSSLRAQTAKL
jgi:hypothetical protein